MIYCLSASGGYGLIIWLVILAIFFIVVVFIIVKLIQIICRRVAEKKRK